MVIINWWPFSKTTLYVPCVHQYYKSSCTLYKTWTTMKDDKSLPITNNANLLTLTESLSSLYADFTIASIFSLFNGCLYSFGEAFGFSNIVLVLLPGIFSLLFVLSLLLIRTGLWVCDIFGMGPFWFNGSFLPGFAAGADVGIDLWAISCRGTWLLNFFCKEGSLNWS